MAVTLAERLAERAYEQVMNSIKVIGSAPCKIKGHDYNCSCPRAIACMNASDHIRTERIYYCMMIECMLLDKEHAWNYTGDKVSHHTFTDAEGLTPEHFIRRFVQEHPVASKFFAPSGKLQTTIQATLALWTTARNAQWREKYTDRGAAQQKWSDEAYTDCPRTRTRHLSDLPPGLDYKTGTAYMEREQIAAGVLRAGNKINRHWLQVAVPKEDSADTVGRTPYGLPQSSSTCVIPTARPGKGCIRAVWKKAQALCICRYLIR